MCQDRWTTLSASHSTPDRPVHDSGTNMTSLGSILAMQQLRMKTTLEITFPLLSIARYFSGKVPIECYIQLFQSYRSTHYGSIIWPLHDRGFNDFCLTWNKGVRRMLNISNMTHTALLGQLINTCQYLFNW